MFNDESLTFKDEGLKGWGQKFRMVVVLCTLSVVLYQLYSVLCTLFLHCRILTNFLAPKGSGFAKQNGFFGSFGNTPNVGVFGAHEAFFCSAL